MYKINQMVLISFLGCLVCCSARWEQWEAPDPALESVDLSVVPGRQRGGGTGKRGPYDKDSAYSGPTKKTVSYTHLTLPTILRV